MTEPTIYLVDDDESVRDALSALLVACGYPNVATFPSAEALVASLQGPMRGCVLMDVRMPGMSGLEFVEAYVPRPVDVPVIMLTAHGDVPSAVRAVRAGARTMLEKPIESALLVNEIAQALAASELTWRLRLEAADLSERLGRLTPREAEVLDLLFEGRRNKDVAQALDISERTVEVHRARVLEKTGSDSVTDLVRRLLEFGLHAAAS